MLTTKPPVILETKSLTYGYFMEYRYYAFQRSNCF